MSSDPRISTEAAVARVDARLDGIGREIGQLRDDITGRLARIEAQTTKTNGRVTANDLRIHDLERINEDRDEDAANDVARRDRNFNRAAWVIGVLLTVLLAGIGWIITILGG